MTVVATVFTTVTLAAAPRQEVRFPIDAIAVEGVRAASQRIIVAETRLREGEAYSETELRDAMFRVSRLPFVLHSDFRLQKAAERGHFILVVTISATKPFFAGFTSLHRPVDPGGVIGLFLDPAGDTFHPLLEVGEDRWNQRATFGARFLAGSRSLLHAAVERGERTRYTAGITQYDVLGTRAALTAAVSYTESSLFVPDALEAVGRGRTSFGDHIGAEIAAVVPIAHNNAVRAIWSRTTTPFTYRATSIVYTDGQFRVVRLREDRIELAFLHDTTNDPLFPTSGLRAKLAVETGRELRLLPGPTRFTFDIDYAHTRDTVAGVARYWSFGEQTIWGAANLQTKNDNRFRQYDARAGYATTLSFGRLRDAGDLRFEAEVQHAVLQNLPVARYDSARAGLAFRNAWGVVRFDYYVSRGQQP